MQGYELENLIKYQYYKDKESWEQTRDIMWIVAQVNSKKKLSSQDILTFPWDSIETARRQSVTNEEKVRLQRMVNDDLELLNNNL